MCYLKQYFADFHQETTLLVQLCFSNQKGLTRDLVKLGHVHCIFLYDYE